MTLRSTWKPWSRLYFACLASILTVNSVPNYPMTRFDLKHMFLRNKTGYLSKNFLTKTWVTATPPPPTKFDKCRPMHILHNDSVYYCNFRDPTAREGRPIYHSLQWVAAETVFNWVCIVFRSWVPSRDGGGWDSLYGHPSAGGGAEGGRWKQGGGRGEERPSSPDPLPLSTSTLAPSFCVFPNNQLVANNWHLSCKVGCRFAANPAHVCVNAFAAPFTMALMGR